MEFEKTIALWDGDICRNGYSVDKDCWGKPGTCRIIRIQSFGAPSRSGKTFFPSSQGPLRSDLEKKIRMSIKVIKLAHQSDILDISKYYHIPCYTVLISHHFLFLGIRQHINTLYYGMVLF